MANKSVLVVLIIIVLILGAVGFAIAMSSFNSDDFFNQKKAIREKNIQEPEYAYQKSTCNSIDNLPCFRYSEVEQTKSEPNYPKLEQTRLEPCQPKHVCPLCREKIRQIRGDGHRDKIVQTRIGC